MTAALLERPLDRRTRNGGGPARRAVIRWGVRLFRREWRQQLLILVALGLAVAATVTGLAVVVNAAPPPRTTFNLPGSDPQLAADIAAFRRRRSVRPMSYAHEKVAVPGSLLVNDLRAPLAGTTTATLRLLAGRYPTDAGEVAMTRDVADLLGVSVGATWTEAGRARQVVGLVENPRDLDDQFVLAPRGQLDRVDTVTIRYFADLPRPPRGVSAAERDAPHDRVRVARVAGGGGHRRPRPRHPRAALRRPRGRGRVHRDGPAPSARPGHARRHRRHRPARAAGDARQRCRRGRDGGRRRRWPSASARGSSWPRIWRALAAHRIDRFDLPWWAIAAAGLLAVVTAVAASWWPARAVARIVDGRRTLRATAEAAAGPPLRGAGRCPARRRAAGARARRPEQRPPRRHRHRRAPSSACSCSPRSPSGASRRPAVARQWPSAWRCATWPATRPAPAPPSGRPRSLSASPAS